MAARPASIQMLAEYLGDAAAIAVCRAFGGVSVKVPRRKAGRAWDEIVAAIGEETASEFVSAFSGEHLYIARNAAEERAKRREYVLAKLASGRSLREVAMSETFVVRYTERGLRKLIDAGNREADERQIDLIED